MFLQTCASFAAWSRTFIVSVNFDGLVRPALLPFPCFLVLLCFRFECVREGFREFAPCRQGGMCIDLGFFFGTLCPRRIIKSFYSSLASFSHRQLSRCPALFRFSVNVSATLSLTSTENDTLSLTVRFLGGVLCERH